MAYIIGIIVIIVVIGLLWEVAKKALSFLIGLAILAAISIAAISWGPAIIMGVVSLISSILPYLLYIAGGLIALSLLYIIITRFKEFFVKYPWQVTLILVVLIVAGAFIYTNT